MKNKLSPNFMCPSEKLYKRFLLYIYDIIIPIFPKPIANILEETLNIIIVLPFLMAMGFLLSLKEFKEIWNLKKINIQLQKKLDKYESSITNINIKN